MNAGKMLFAQLMDFLPWTSFARSVSRYGGDCRVRSFPCTEQYRAMAFAQLTYRESLRDIEACLNAQSNKLYAMGFRAPVRRSTVADANERRDWRIYADFAQHLIGIARPLYARDPLGVDLDQSLYTILQFLSVSIFEKTPISDAFSQEFYKTKMSDHDNQLLLFNL